MTSYAKPETLIATALAPMDWTRSVSLVVAFSLFNALAAQISIPIGPVPITGQTFAVTLTGALLGSRLGAAALIVYLLEGFAGLPFFAGSASGIAVLYGPRAGYLIAFPAAAYITGAFAEHGWDRRFLTSVAAMAVGSAIILLAGWAWWMVLGSSPLKAFMFGVAPFIVGDIVKILLAAAVLPTGWAILKKKASS
jgi:biotin transport system substrate-specific component